MPLPSIPSTCYPEKKPRINPWRLFLYIIIFIHTATRFWQMLHEQGVPGGMPERKDKKAPSARVTLS